MRKNIFSLQKNIVAIATVAMLLPCFTEAQTHIEFSPDEGVTVRINPQGYTITFQTSDYFIENVEIDDDIQETFSCIHFDQDIYSTYDYEGRAELPYYSLDLQVPNDCQSISLSCSANEKGEEYLDYPYLPAQGIIEGNVDESYIMLDQLYYNSNGTGWNDEIAYNTNIYHYMNTSGFSLVIHPFRYKTLHSKLLIRDIIEISITIESEISLIDMYNDYISGNHYDDAINYYDTYKSSHPDTFNPNDKGKYAILTTDTYHDKIDGYFGTHKTVYGYDVITYTIENDIDQNRDKKASPDEIRKFIYYIWHDENTRPRFILLAGNFDDFPFSAGELLNADNPPTDIYYACIENGYGNFTEPNLHPDVHIGRWVFNSPDELDEIMDKTVLRETDIPNLDIALFSGTGQGQRKFYRANQWVVNKVLKKSNYNYTNYDGRNGFSKSHMQSELSDKWMFVYRGHANTCAIGEPYEFYSWEIESVNAIFGFGFACLLNSPIDPYNETPLGINWLIDPYGGGPVFYAATTASIRSCNNKLEKQIFKMLQKDRNMTIAQMINGGTNNYYNRKSNSSRKAIQIKKYMLLGDPSLYIWGTSYATGLPQTRTVQARNKPISTPSNVETNIEHMNEVALVNVYNMSGQLIAHTQDLATMPQLVNGMYLLQIILQDGHSFTEKFIINNNR